MRKTRTMCWILLVLTVLLSLFIWGRSFKNTEQSHKESDVIVEIVKPIIQDVVSADESRVDWLVRKSAHFIEYAVLGGMVMALIWSVREELRRSLYGFGFFYVLFVAVVDEYIQSFSDRTSSVSDVMLDFAGGLMGFAMVIVIIKSLVWCKQRKTK